MHASPPLLHPQPPKQPSNCALKTSFVTSIFSTKNATVSGSFIVSNPTKQPLPVTQTPVLAVTSVVPKGSSWSPPPPNSLGYGTLRPFRPYNGPYDVQQAILEYPVPRCLPGSPDKPVFVQPGKSVTCTFATPAAAVAGTRAVSVSVSFDVSLKDVSGMCAADAAKTVAV